MKILLSAVAGLAVLAHVTSAQAEESVPNLEGTWLAAEGEAMYANGRLVTLDDHVTSYELVISGQQGSVFKAVQTVTPKGDAELGKHGDEPSNGRPIHIVGAVTATGPMVVMVDIEDTTTTACSLISEDTMRCLTSEPGKHAFAGTLLLKRQ